MNAIAKWGVRVAVGLVALAVIALAVVFAASETVLHQHYAFVATPLAPLPGAADAAAGTKLVRLFGCEGCHKADLHGEVMFDDPMVGRLSAPNLTLAVRNYSDAQLAEVIRAGVRPDGRALYFMPSEVFSRLTDSEIAQVIAYLRSRPAGGVMGGDSIRLGPIGRIGLIAGKIQSAPQLVASYRARPLPDYGPATAEGRGLARACSACHGADLGGDIGPDLRIAAAYDPAAFARLLRGGIALDGRPVRPIGALGDGKRIGLMAQIAPLNFGGLSDAEIAALHAYLTTRVAHLP